MYDPDRAAVIKRLLARPEYAKAMSDQTAFWRLNRASLRVLGDLLDTIACLEERLDAALRLQRRDTLASGD